MLSLPLGRWDYTPIPLTGVTVKDFDLFLSIIYPVCVLLHLVFSLPRHK
jgi:hypothetical protein